jgi:hypothetical protein
MKKRKPNNIAAIEKAIAEKYGSETIVNPKSGWSEEKEKEYLEQLKELSLREQRQKEQTDKIEKDGFFVGKHLISKKKERNCPVCDIYSFDMRDDLYMNKFECCFKCFIQWVEHREERWQKGWRPNKEQI